jgi:lipid A 4'-phosphatase
MRNEPGAAAHLRRAKDLPMRIGIVALALWLLASIMFLAFPEVDLQVSRLFYAGNHRFFGQAIGWVRSARSGFAGGFYLCIAATIAGLVFTRNRGRTWLGLAFAQWMFLAICLAAGPGLVANVGLKDHWGRARPNEIAEFGGKRSFTPALLPTNQCDSNCSFVSGEAASVFLPLYAMALLLPQWATLLLAAGTVCGLTAGLVRVAQGGHFLSDVVFAGIFMLLTAVIVHLAVFRWRPTGGRTAAANLAGRAAPERAEECSGQARSAAPAPAPMSHGGAQRPRALGAE